MPGRRLAAAGLLIASLFLVSFTYKVARPDRTFSFPRDHFAHPEFRLEWWYYTGHLKTNGGRGFGYQVTFFRYGLRDRQGAAEETRHLFTDLYMAHFALSDKDAERFVFRDRANRGYEGKAGALVDRYLVWNEDWKVEADGQSHIITVRDRDRGLRLRLTPLKPPVLHGQGGFSRKGAGPGTASHYYSLTRLETEGELEIGGVKERVRGLSWMDHEFGGERMGPDQVGWDWFSIQLDNEREIMLYLMRRKDGSVDYAHGTLVQPDGTPRHLSGGEFGVEVLERWKSPASDAVYPIRWTVRIPSEEVTLEINPFFPQQELDTRKSTRVTYWEGSVRVRGAYRERPVEGLGYVEMTGYAGKLTL